MENENTPDLPAEEDTKDFRQVSGRLSESPFFGFGVGHLLGYPPPTVHADITIHGTPTQRSALWLAMGKARVGFERVTKSVDGQSGQQKFKYASFAQLSAAMIEPLAEQGLSILQMITTPTEGLGCVTTLLAGHGAELWVVTRFATADNEHGFQATIKDFGAQTTYYKRYQLQAIGFIEGDRDADQDPKDMPGPNRSTKDRVQPQAMSKTVTQGITEDQIAEVGRLMMLLKNAKGKPWTRQDALDFTATLFGRAKGADEMSRTEADVMIGAMRAELPKEGA